MITKTIKKIFFDESVLINFVILKNWFFFFYIIKRNVILYILKKNNNKKKLNKIKIGSLIKNLSFYHFFFLFIFLLKVKK